MDDSVLRGFCQKCGLVVELNSYKEKQWIVHCNPTRNSFCEPDAVWFLSAKQMKIVFESDEFEEWAGQENYFELCNNAFTLIVKVLEDNPFLVSKILKEAEEKSKEENK